MNTPPQGVYIPLQVTYEGEPLNLDTADALRRVRSYLDAWIGIYEGAEKLRQLAPSLSLTTPPNALAAQAQPPVKPARTQQSRAKATATASTLPVHTIDYIVLALQTLGDPLPLKAVYHHIITLGWSTISPDMQKALRNLENTARNHKELVTVEKGVARLVRRG